MLLQSQNALLVVKKTPQNFYQCVILTAQPFSIDIAEKTYGNPVNSCKHLQFLNSLDSKTAETRNTKAFNGVFFPFSKLKVDSCSSMVTFAKKLNLTEIETIDQIVLFIYDSKFWIPIIIVWFVRM